MLPVPTILQTVLLSEYQTLAGLLEAEKRGRAADQQRIRDLEDEVVSVPTAMKLTGLGRTTLYQERKRQGSLLVAVAYGRKIGFKRSSCVEYRKARELGRHRPG